MSEPISLRLPKETITKLDKLANKEQKDRSTLIRELLDNGIQEKDIEHAVDSYKNGQTTSWKAAQNAGISLWKFLEILQEKGILLQYTELDLKKDLKALIED